MTPYSIDLRQKIVAALNLGVGSQRAVAELFGVSLSFVERLLQRQRMTGTLAPLPHGGGPPRCVDETDERLIRQCLEQQPDLTLDELREILAQQNGKSVSRATMGRAVQRLNLPRKKRRFTRRSVRQSG
jgi:transposase